MIDDGSLLGESYLQFCTDEDLRLLAAGDASSGASPATLRQRPELVTRLLGDEQIGRLVFAGGVESKGLFPASPFLVFAVAVHRVQADLATASYVEEWLGPRRRTPVFDVGALRDFLASGWRRLFLAELLASYTRVASGSFAVHTSRGLRRRRFSELDPVRLAELLEVVPDIERPGVYRRLGDLSLFLTGVFPDHTALHGLSGPDESRLLRAGRIDPRDRPSSSAIAGFGEASAVDLFEQLGRRWYRLAAELLPHPVPLALGPVAEMAERFGEARRVLNVLTDQFLFPLRAQLFGLSPN